MIELPKGVVLRDLLLFLKNIGLKSSSILRDYEDGLIPLYDSSENLHQSYNHKDPVTSADLAINKFITEKFISNYSTVQWEVITEENSKENLFNKSTSDWVWLIDPLDGTKDFIQKTGEYAIHIALAFKNKPILGMVALPNKRELWFGIEGIGTWREEKNSPLENKKFVSFSKRKASNLVTSKNHSNKKLNFILRELDYENNIRMGSIGYKICSLLRNESDIYLSISDKTSPKDWDIAAPHALIRGAKCNFTYVSGNEINYIKTSFEQRGCLIASTLLKKEHLEICKKVSDIIKKNF